MVKARKTAAPTRDSAARLERMDVADAATASASTSLLDGNKFYLSWSIPAERRRELRALIQVHSFTLSFTDSFLCATYSLCVHCSLFV